MTFFQPVNVFQAYQAANGYCENGDISEGTCDGDPPHFWASFEAVAGQEYLVQTGNAQAGLAGEPQAEDAKISIFDPTAVDMATATAEEIEAIAVIGESCFAECDRCDVDPGECRTMLDLKSPLYPATAQEDAIRARFDELGVPAMCGAVPDGDWEACRNVEQAEALAAIQEHKPWVSRVCSFVQEEWCGSCFSDCFDNFAVLGGASGDEYEASAHFTAPTTGTYAIKVAPESWGSYQVIVSGGDASCTRAFRGAPTCGDGLDANGDPCAVNAEGTRCAVENIEIPDSDGSMQGRCNFDRESYESTCGAGNDANGNACELNADKTGCAVESGSCEYVPLASFRCECGEVHECLLPACNAEDAPCSTEDAPAKVSAAYRATGIASATLVLLTAALRPAF